MTWSPKLRGEVEGLLGARSVDWDEVVFAAVQAAERSRKYRTQWARETRRWLRLSGNGPVATDADRERDKRYRNKLRSEGKKRSRTPEQRERKNERARAARAAGKKYVRTPEQQARNNELNRVYRARKKAAQSAGES